MVQFTDVDNTVEIVQAAHDDCKNDPKFYETLLEDAQKPFILVVETLQSCLHW